MHRFLPVTWLVAQITLAFAAGAEITTIAGTGAKGFSGDGGPATAAQLAEPFGLARGADGALYFCDCDNQRIRRIGADGVISTVAGNGTRGYSGDGGPAVQASLNEPYEMRFDQEGNMFFVERLNHLVRRVDGKTGIISTVAGCGEAGFDGDGGPAVKAHLNQPHSIALDQSGDIYICDIMNRRIRKVEMKTGLITTIAGTGEKTATPDGAPIATAPLNGPRAADIDGSGNLWVALREGNAIYRLDFKDGFIHRVAGTGKQGFTGNGGPALKATLSGPKGLSVGPNGNIYFADTESHTVRMIDAQTGAVEVVIGTGKKGDGPDGDPLKCGLARPHSVFVDRDGTLYIGDTEDHRIRKLSP